MSLRKLEEAIQKRYRNPHIIKHSINHDCHSCRYEKSLLKIEVAFAVFKKELEEDCEWWKRHTDIDEKAGYGVSEERKAILMFFERLLDEKKET